MSNHPRQNSPADFRASLLTGRWFSAISDSLREDLLAAAVLRELVAGETLFTRGDSMCGVYAVLRGSVMVTGYNVGGAEALLTIVEPPEWFGEIALFDGLVRTHTAIAAETTTLLHMPQASLLRLLDATPMYWHDFGLLLTQKLRLALVALEELALMSGEQRVMRRLLLMAQGQGNLRDRSRRVIPLSQERLGKMVSISRQSVNQILKRLEGEGVLRLAYRGIEILDVQALRRLVELESTVSKTD